MRKKSDNYIMKMPTPRLGFNELVDKLFWTLLIGLGAYCATEIRGLGDSINKLNETVVRMDAREQQSQERIKELSQKIEMLDVRLRAVEILSNGKK